MAASHYYHPGKCLVYPNSMSSVRMNMTQKKKKRERDCTIYRQPLGWNSKTLCRVKEDSLQRRTLYHSIYMTFPEDRKKKKSDVEQISA